MEIISKTTAAQKISLPIRQIFPSILGWFRQFCVFFLPLCIVFSPITTGTSCQDADYFPGIVYMYICIPINVKYDSSEHLLIPITCSYIHSFVACSSRVTDEQTDNLICRGRPALKKSLNTTNYFHFPFSICIAIQLLNLKNMNIYILCVNVNVQCKYIHNCINYTYKNYTLNKLDVFVFLQSVTRPR